MSIATGTRLGAYDIVSLLGEGGMGAVYRARDTKLKREVAIKVLPADVAGDGARLARFQREAEVLAALRPRGNRGGAYTEAMSAAAPFETVSLEPSPTIDAYKSGIDRTLLRENLRLTPAERVDRMVAALRFAEAVRASRTTAAG